MATERQLNLLLIFVTVNALCVVLVNCCGDDDEIYMPSCNSGNPPTPKTCPPPTSTCDTTVKGVCVVDPLCTGGIGNVVTWRMLSGCQRQKLKKERTQQDLPNLLFLGNADQAKCNELSNNRIGIFGCCEKTKCRNKCGSPKQNCPYNCLS